MALRVKNPLTNTGDINDAGSVPGQGRSPEKEMATHSSILAWMEELQSMGSQLDMTE